MYIVRLICPIQYMRGGQVGTFINEKGRGGSNIGTVRPGFLRWWMRWCEVVEFEVVELEVVEFEVVEFEVVEFEVEEFEVVEFEVVEFEVVEFEVVEFEVVEFEVVKFEVVGVHHLIYN